MSHRSIDRARSSTEGRIASTDIKRGAGCGRMFKKRRDTYHDESDYSLFRNTDGSRLYESHSSDQDVYVVRFGVCKTVVKYIAVLGSDLR